MKFSIEGNEYAFEDKLTVEEAMFIFEKSHVGLANIFPELKTGNPFVIAAMVHIARKRSGEASRWEDMNGLDLFTFKVLPDDKPEPDPVDDKPGPGPDPTN